MQKFTSFAATAALLTLLGAGCSATKLTTSAPVTVPATGEVPTSTSATAPTPAAQVDLIVAMRQKFANVQLAYTEKSQMSDVAKMHTRAGIADAVKFKFTAGQGTVAVLVVILKDASQAATVKAEIDSQYAALKTISSTIQIQWLPGDATHLVVMNYANEDVAVSQAVAAAYANPSTGGSASAPVVTLPPQAAIPAQINAIFKVGDHVLGDWQKGSKWWTGKVTATDGSTVSIKYDDGTSETVDTASVAHAPSAPASVKVGEKVVAKWNNSSFYAGTVTAVSGTTATVAWADGTSPSSVPLTEITFAGK